MANKFPKLADLADQTDPLIARRVLLESLDQVIEMCAGAQRMNNRGEYYDDPDHANLIKALELGGRITGTIGVDPTVLLQFRNDTEKLVKRATNVLREREGDANRNLPEKKPSRAILAVGEEKR